MSRWLAVSIGGAALGALGLSACAEPAPDVLAAVYRVEVDHCQAVDHQRATAVAVSPQLLATVAHSLDLAKTVSVEDASGAVVAAEVIYIDIDKDVALLRIDASSVVPLALAPPEESGEVTIATASNPDGDGPTTKRATIVDLVSATLDGEGRRAAVKLEADIKPGDSGAAVVDDEQRMVAMVFATARNDHVGWAVASSEIEAAIESLNGSRPEALPPAC